MTGVNAGNPEPTPGNNPEKYDEHTCGLCGQEGIKKLSAHLRKEH